MAIITEEPDSPKSSSTETSPLKPHSPSSSTPSPSPSPSSSSCGSGSGANPFQFWFYFTLSVTLITLFFVSLPSFTTQDPKKWFLTLPPNLRQHYSKGRIFKVQIRPNLPQVEAFSIQDGPGNSDHKVLIVHGFGCSSYAFRGVVKSLGLKGIHAIAIDLPGSGFSDKSMAVMEENVGGGGGLSELWEVYNEIKENGLFSGFDQLIEKGYIDHEEKKLRVSKREVVKSIELGTEEMGRVLSQVINEMGLAPIDLVLHDSALGLSANWISENSKLVRSVILLDSLPYRTAMPLWAVGVPVLREVILGFGFVFERVLEKFCLKSVTKSEAEAHRILLKGRDWGRSAIEMGKRVNYSLDLSEWVRLDGVKGLPMRVIWSNSSFLEWSQEGSWIRDSLHQATFVSHSGGPWAQEDAASEEIAESIYEFVSSLPKASRQAEEEPIPEHIKMMLDESKNSDHHQHIHGSHNHHDGHVHAHAHAGYADAYGLGDGWTM